MVSAGHPWVFRDSLMRDLDGVAAGQVIAISDPDGVHLAQGLVEPSGAVALRIVSRRAEFEWTDEEIAARIDAAIAYREAAGFSAQGTAYRVIHGEGDRLPGVAVERFGDYLVVYKYSLGAEAWIERMIPILADRLKPKGIYLQDRLKPVTPDDRRAPAFHMAGKVAPPSVEATEAGLTYAVDVTAPVSPGLFVDLREGRELVESLAKDRRVLNLFSFTGSLGIRAVRGGATEVVNVDAAAKAHARCRVNLEANGMDPQACDSIVGDVFATLEKMRKREREFDLVVVDPPPFSKVKGKVFSALRDFEELICACLGVVAPGGYLLVVSNAAKLSDEELMQAIGYGSDDARRTTRLVAERGLPGDFPVPPAFSEGRYLKVKLLSCP